MSNCELPDDGRHSTDVLQGSLIHEKEATMIDVKSWGFTQNALGEFVLRVVGIGGQVAEIPAHTSIEAQALAIQERIQNEIEF